MELKENKTAALLGEEDSLEMKDKVFDLVLLCPFISSDDVDLYGYMAPTLVLLAFNSFFLFWIMGVGLGFTYPLKFPQYYERHFPPDRAVEAPLPDRDGPRPAAPEGRQGAGHHHPSLRLHLPPHHHRAQQGRRHILTTKNIL